MHRLKITLFVAGLAGLGLWQLLKPPYSPSQTLPPVSYAAFRIGGSTEKIPALVRSIGLWKEVTATSYNPESGLLAVAYTTDLSETALLRRLGQLSQGPVSKVHFSTPAGPECPVPHHLLQLIPTGLLLLSLTALLIALWLSLRHRVQALVRQSS